jgi:hypothetical protein
MATTPRKTFPELQALSAPVVDSDVLAVYRSPGPAKRTTASVLQSYFQTGVALLTTLAASGGSALIGYIDTGTGAVARTLQTLLREVLPVSAKSFGATGDGVTDDTVALQRALDAAFAQKRDLFIPAGYYITTATLVLPGDVTPPVDNRDRFFRVYGAGYGEPYVVAVSSGTTIERTNAGTVLQDNLGTHPSSNGTTEISHFRVVGASGAGTGLVLLQSFYGLSTMHNMVLYQKGVGDGLKCTYAGGIDIHNIFTLNLDWATTGLGSSRTGIGFNIPNTYDVGLLTLRKCSARGYLTGFALNGTGGTLYSPMITECEASVTYNGITVVGCKKAVIHANYLEGGDGGDGIMTTSDYTTISDNLMFPGYAIGIKDESSSVRASRIVGNTVSIGARANSKCASIVAGINKTIKNNAFIYTAGTAGCSGLYITGSDYRGSFTDNAFDPEGAWTGAGTTKISTNGVAIGMITGVSSAQEFPVLSQGAISLLQGPNGLTQTNVTSNILTLPGDNSYYRCNASSATTVLKIATGLESGKIVIFKCDTADMTFTDGAYMTMAGNASFSGPGMIGFIIERVGADNYAYEMFRTVF